MTSQLSSDSPITAMIPAADAHCAAFKVCIDRHNIMLRVCLKNRWKTGDLPVALKVISHNQFHFLLKVLLISQGRTHLLIPFGVLVCTI